MNKKNLLVIGSIIILLTITVLIIAGYNKDESKLQSNYIEPEATDVQLSKSTDYFNCKGTQKPPAPFKESYDPQGEQTYCLNGSILFISQNISFAWLVNGSNLVKMVGTVSYSDMYVNNINYNSPQSLSNNVTPITVEFNYSIPSWSIPEGIRKYFGNNTIYCPTQDIKYGAFISNDNKDDFNNISFFTGDKRLFQGKECDIWHNESINIPDLKKTSPVFSFASKKIGSAGLEIPNVYIDLNSLRFCKNENCVPLL